MFEQNNQIYILDFQVHIQIYRACIDKMWIFRYSMHLGIIIANAILRYIRIAARFSYQDVSYFRRFCNEVKSNFSALRIDLCTHDLEVANRHEKMIKLEREM